MESKLLGIPFKALQDLAFLTSLASSQAPLIAGDKSVTLNIFESLECTMVILPSTPVHNSPSCPKHFPPDLPILPLGSLDKIVLPFTEFSILYWNPFYLLTGANMRKDPISILFNFESTTTIIPLNISSVITSSMPKILFLDSSEHSLTFCRPYPLHTSWAQSCE
jgi:hypothetical protein